ncbi:shikimate dehydrogenase family protein [Thermomonospora umbrina]|uniref:Shikimate dehydrogenase n=1 Tax=Thermomonospora umbrina TaxID=111806 RepID=A0A3D9SGJ6_9ACTN|nr:shikimate dehydrogenase [Thermomonospora umbrina]REE94807.1 shikimate dehydrogenase [Thermomonospora umbrina]
MTRSIGGATRLFAVLGDPVAQVRAPALVNPLFAELGLDAVLVPAHVRPADLAAVVRGLEAVGNLDGLLITVPHKFTVCGLAAELGRGAELAGSANALRRRPGGGWFADNFDGAGFVAGLEHAGHPVAGRRFLLAGAGGAGTAIAVALLEAGAERLTVREPDVARLDRLVGRLERHWPGRARGSAVPPPGDADVVDVVDVVVNATPLGLRADDPMPFAPAELPPGCVVADIIMSPPDTPLLVAAAGLGHPVHHGRHMLDQQLDLYRDFFGL